MPLLSPTWTEFISVTLAVLGLTLTGVRVMLSHSEARTTEKLAPLLKDIDNLADLVRAHKHVNADGTLTQSGVIFDR